MPEETRKAIQVTESFLPPQEEFMGYVDEIFKSHYLTNQGPYVKKLEADLKQYLGVPQLTTCANGTLALQLALRLLELNGKKVITTPFTYVATLSSLLWENCQPVFADIDPETLCLDPEAVRQTLKDHPDTAGILPVHVFGNACDVEAFADLAQEFNLNIIYDGAHAFGSRLNDRSLLDYGDASTCSFHATKLFHTVEGGCIVTHEPKNSEELTLLRAFGHLGDNHIQLGINAKLSELHAAMGLSVLRHMDSNLTKRAKLAALYDEFLNIKDRAHIRTPRMAPGLDWNHAYYPVIFNNESALKKVTEALNKEGIFPRRYFYPSLTELPYVPRQICPVSDDIARRILCLPFWADIEIDNVKNVAKILNKSIS